MAERRPRRTRASSSSPASDNQCFLPESQRRTYRAASTAHRPGYHALHVIPGYGHLDIFMGKDAARDVFPLILAELDQPV